jgi:hypothetical protein
VTTYRWRNLREPQQFNHQDEGLTTYHEKSSKQPSQLTAWATTRIFSERNPTDSKVTEGEKLSRMYQGNGGERTTFTQKPLTLRAKSKGKDEL